MPELPEVETIKKGLKILIGKKLNKYIIYKDGWRKPIPIKKIDSLINKPVLDVYRRAKWLALIFEEGCLWFHLGMSGKIKASIINGNALHKHDHVEFVFDDIMIRFQDDRRFGFLCWTEGKYSEPPSSSKLGYEPFDKNWTNEVFFNQLKTIKTPIKPLLMNSKIVVGAGNIYACEALFKSKILPTRASNSLTFQEISLLRESIISILKESIKNGGSTLKDHRTIEGNIGHFQDQHLVYGKENQHCKNCNNLIKKIEQSGRSTFYCDFCQK